MKRVMLLCWVLILPFFMASQAFGHGGGDVMGDWDAADACTAVKGHYTVHFTAYQELIGAGMIPLMHEVGSEQVKKEFQSYCEGVPKTGKLSMAFDLYNEEMRALPISVKIVEATEAHEDKGDTAHSHVVFSLPPAVYGDGSIRIDTEILKAGHYIALMTLEKVGPGIAHKLHRGSEIGEWQRVSHTHGPGTDPTEAQMHAVNPTYSFPFTVGLAVRAHSRLPWFMSNLGFQLAMTLLALCALVGGIKYYMNGRQKKPA
ncbi:hypothetical protein MELA_02618 [Candidatus Methylomirabilis lanthanidiphila]|uniref:Uncharacterized protein n=1 Tax=Candidatus Methylomirabilis lanthanidiphila TaxID=2211376 RepID=A0A564ZNT2_9BACT|nr:hypothetical protein [Candidatus Methylomirabilis lanthanidiphila]VUZ86218.1 hypothetical protein MELA_02618 [Candidatus Methylomirabilis lanthanidiphila]